MVKGAEEVAAEKAGYKLNPGTWVRKNLYLFRVIIAILLCFSVYPMLDIGKALFVKNIDYTVKIPVSKTSTESTLPVITIDAKKKTYIISKDSCGVAHRVPIATDSENKVESCRNEKQTTSTENWQGSTTQQVWGYGLQLAAWLGVMGVLLWAVIALIRDE